MQTGETDSRTDSPSATLYSLGSIAHQPLLIFYRSPTPVSFLSEFAGKRLAVGPPGSGTRTLALKLLETNGISPGGATAFPDLNPNDAAKALLNSNVDAVFLMGDSASGQTMRTLMRTPGVQLFDFVQADGYTRRFNFLTKLTLPQGSIDLGKDVPAHDVNLVGPTVELVSRANLHPAICDLLLEAARQVHGNATLLQHRGEFPAPLEQEFKISDEAMRYYKSGKSFLYRSLPFWLASLINRVVVAFVPMVLLLVPGLKLIPAAYKWRIQLHIYRWYRGLLRGGTGVGEHRELRGTSKAVGSNREISQCNESARVIRQPVLHAAREYRLRARSIGSAAVKICSSLKKDREKDPVIYFFIKCSTR